MSSQAPTIAFFGATGGVVNSALVHALRAGRAVVALVRTPSKLTTQLEAQGLDSSILAAQLTIITGNALDREAVKQTLTANRSSYLVSHIVTGLGAAPSFSFNWRHPLQLFSVDQPSLCGDAAQVLLAALGELYQENASLRQQKPHVTFVSTTGISRGAEDVPFGLRTFYHVLLEVPHIDKKVMENTYRGNVEENDQEDALFSSFVGIRPTLLTGGISVDEGAGLEKIRAGTEANPATGYTICRADVGHWMWKNVIADDEVRTSYRNEMVSLA